MKNLAILLGTGLILFLTGCEKAEWLTAGDYFFLENKGATMPVWVKGNSNSDVYIITVHGGPGGGTSGHEFPISAGFKLLEEDYNLVYWDQRMSGMSQGNPDKSDLTIEQHIEDLDKLVHLIIHKYNPQSLFLLGHSWGGVMTGGYLGIGNNQDKFNGWIDLDGSIQEAFEVQEMKTWILDRVPEAYDRDPEFYQFIIDWYEENPHPKASDPYPYWYASNFNGYAYDYEKSNELNPVPYFDLAFRSPFTTAFYWTQYSDTRWADGYDVTTQVSDIQLPSLLLWGAEDGIVTANVAQFTYDYLGTDSLNKHLVLIEECAHSPHYDTPDRFALEIENFVEEYR